MSNYRIRYRKGDFELEVESTEKQYVDSKFKELLNAKPDSAAQAPKKKTARKKPASNSKQNDSKQGGSGQIDIPAVIEAINDSDDHEAIDENILSKSGQLPRIIMCLKFAESTLDSPYLTTGHIQTITDQLGIKIKSQNAATTIKSNQKYFTADAVRKAGTIIKYKLNRKGLTAYNNLLKGEKIS
ncbi:MAG TPA: hypothetical protein ENJ28_03500 [Gammaproteobacteria bacterium]|nr:hypothetical protein [Gammaproteobacteria bacterium]